MMRRLFLLALVSLFLFGCDQNQPQQTATTSTMTITDMAGRSVEVPVHPQRVLASGSGCLRYLTYLQAQDRIVGVDSAELEVRLIDARPYAMANPQFKQLPLFGQFRGHDNPELIAALEPQPQVIFKTYGTMGHDPDELQQKTGIPVVVLDYGDLGVRRNAMKQALTLMAKVLGAEDRAKAVVDFMENTIADLQKRTEGLQGPSCYVGGIAFKGPHGFRSTEPGYPPFQFLNARNVAAPQDGSEPLRHADMAKEMILEWNPGYLFVDLSTIRAGAESNSLYELHNDPSFQELTACKQDRVFGVLPYNWYTSNHGNTLADAYFIGKILYPEAFADVDSASKADEIYTFLVGKPVFTDLSAAFGGLAFKRLDPSVIRIGDKGKILSK
ncbi:iron ABC transporter substrate-binding protein [Salidesulfovibrio onnuriiensis]|uniref:iron ABC transporter substrate-binding protein n=1 Tax=Salidesulfovibrio onnuriiensis TaxID=2583823 RepID=UPI00202B5770|nr:iron ABC transporter substrate-binding protein [Salidesulfovibrio onnuriiensis]